MPPRVASHFRSRPLKTAWAGGGLARNWRARGPPGPPGYAGRVIVLSLRIGEPVSEQDRRTLAWIRERTRLGLPVRDVFLLDARGREIAKGDSRRY